MTQFLGARAAAHFSGAAVGILTFTLLAEPARADDPTLALLALTQTLAINETAQTVSTVGRAGLSAAETQLRSIQDRLQAAQSLGMPVLAYADMQSRVEAAGPESWYATDLRAVPPPEPVSALRFATWAQGFGDYERRNIVVGTFDFGRTTRTGGGLGGVDVTKIGVFSASDAAVVGILGGYSSGYTRNNDRSTGRVEGGSVGWYSVYVNGGFSINSVSKVDFFDSTSTSAVNFTRFRLDNFNTSTSINYKFTLGTWWLEPTAGVSGTWASYDNAAFALGMRNGQQVRVQGGLRIGTSTDWNGIRIEPTLLGQLYSDVVVHGGTIVTPTAPLVPTLQGKLFALGNAKLNFDFGKGVSSYLEAEVRGSDRVFGAAGRAGIRYQF